MLVVSFFSWWYGRGWRSVAASFEPRFQAVSYNFSVGTLIKTLFAPWRRIITYPGRSLEARARALADNVFSRAVGFVVRIFVLIAAVIALTVVGILTMLEVLIWPLLPIAIPVCFIAGLTL
ncbi:MAG TPA: hypothetical protein VLF79_00260 [Candidatus Saccharimonadales bacterium]|nr:hypothetical protein [Candidatus Saccharimonadales bacterium]